jgi:hypothetical protein
MNYNKPQYNYAIILYHTHQYRNTNSRVLLTTDNYNIM